MEEVAEQKEQAMAHYKHMDLEDRIGIQTGLKEGKTFKEIGEAIGRDASTVAKEIKGHLIVKETGTKSRPYNPCKKRTHVSDLLGGIIVLKMFAHAMQEFIDISRRDIMKGPGLKCIEKCDRNLH